LRGVKLVISDSHEGLKKAVRKVISAAWQRCRVHFMRNVLVHAPAGQRRMVSALIGTIFAQESEGAARSQWLAVAEQLRERFPKIAKLMNEAMEDVLAHMTLR
jgi:transposase-like protein